MLSSRRMKSLLSAESPAKGTWELSAVDWSAAVLAIPEISSRPLAEPDEPVVVSEEAALVSEGADVVFEGTGAVFE